MQIADALLGARYGAIVWDVSGFPAEEAEAAVELIAAMLRQLNANTRCVGLPLGGSENGSGALQAALWQTGWPLRIAFGAQGPLHDPWEFDGPRLLAAGEADALLWVAALAQSAPPPSGVPTVALVGADVELTPHPSVEIRVGIPAVDHGGEIVRGDGLVALPLHPAFASVRPSVAEAAAAILGALGPAA
jgi:formylmethanofuran dehydrogenase subunit B